MSSSSHVVLLFGASGNAGGGALNASLADPTVSEVRAVVRRPLGLSNPKLREIVHGDFTDFRPIEQHFEGVDTCLFCLGTSVRNVKGEDEYRTIHVAYPLAAARALLARSPRASFVYVSGAGTNRRSRMMWARVKAEAEDQLGALGLARLANVRPAALLPLRPSGFGERLSSAVLRALPPISIETVDNGRAMLRLGLDETWNGRRTLENKDLKALLMHSGTSSQ